MNKDRRKALDTILARYGQLYAELESTGSRFDDLRSELESLRDEEQDYYDNMPESLRDGEKANSALSAIESMENAIVLIEGIIEFTESNDESEFADCIEAAKE